MPSSSLVEVKVEVGVEVEVRGVRVGVGLPFLVVSYVFGLVGWVVGEVRDKAISTQVEVEV